MVHICARTSNSLKAAAPVRPGRISQKEKSELVPCYVRLVLSESQAVFWPNQLDEEPHYFLL